MPLLIDCYNVLHATMPPSLAGLDTRGLCQALARSGFAGERIVVVCDGSPKKGVAQSPVEGVSLVYAGKDRSADDMIAQMIAADSAPRRLVVVSSDREVQRAAHRRGAKTMSSGEFIRELAVALTHKPPRRTADKLASGPLGADEVEKWAKQFGVDPQQKLDPANDPQLDED